MAQQDQKDLAAILANACTALYPDFEKGVYDLLEFQSGLSFYVPDKKGQAGLDIREKYEQQWNDAMAQAVPNIIRHDKIARYLDNDNDDIAPINQDAGDLLPTMVMHVIDDMKAFLEDSDQWTCSVTFVLVNQKTWRAEQLVSTLIFDASTSIITMTGCPPFIWPKLSIISHQSAEGRTLPDTSRCQASGELVLCCPPLQSEGQRVLTSKMNDCPFKQQKPCSPEIGLLRHAYNQVDCFITWPVDFFDVAASLTVCTYIFNEPIDLYKYNLRRVYPLSFFYERGFGPFVDELIDVLMALYKKRSGVC